MTSLKHPRHVMHEPGESPSYAECSACGFLTADRAFADGDQPCPLCGAVGTRRTFPSERLRRLDQRVHRYMLDGEDEIVVILAATLLEAMLEDMLARILAAHGADVRVQAVVLDSLRSVGQRLSRLFPALTGEQFEDAAAEVGCRDFPRRWRTLRELRNSFIHDAPFTPRPGEVRRADADEAMVLLDQAYRLFVLMNNRFATPITPESVYEAP